MRDRDKEREREKLTRSAKYLQAFPILFEEERKSNSSLAHFACLSRRHVRGLWTSFFINIDNSSLFLQPVMPKGIEPFLGG